MTLSLRLLCLPLVCGALLYLPQNVRAQETAGQQVAPQQDNTPPASEQQDSQQQNSQPQNTQQPAQQDSDSQPIQPNSGGPDRFIPSEQISQDLGVSFPVDI